MSWQIIPGQLMELMGKDKTGMVMQAMLKMSKIIVADLQVAFDTK
jgi:predicted 3-demethylubiquinone-9 3-methyltransferase (glyoxalase superfamily)